MVRISELPVGDVVIVHPKDIPPELISIMAIELGVQPMNIKEVVGTIVPLDDAVIPEGNQETVTNALEQGYILVNITMRDGPATIMLDGRGEVHR